MGAGLNFCDTDDKSKVQSSGFKPELFYEYQTENTHFDFKKKIYQFNSDKENGKARKEEEERLKYEFVKDIIAFSNVSWRTGKPCYIVFGVSEKKSGKLFDLSNQCAQGKPPGWWGNDEKTVHSKMTDGIVEDYRKVMEAWIGPTIPDFNLEFGCVDGVFVSYLEIKRDQSPEKPYFLKRNYKKARKKTVYLRKNSSSVKLSSQVANTLKRLKYTEVAHIEEKKWKNLLKAFKDTEFKRCFETHYKATIKSTTNVTVEDAVLERVRKGAKETYILGEAGTGKSVILHSVTYQLAEEHSFDKITHNKFYGGKREKDKRLSFELIKNIKEDLESTPIKPIPVFFSLRKNFDDKADFEHTLLRNIERKLGVEEEKFDSFKSLYDIPGIKWILLLDGLDEIRNREEFGSKLKNWIEDLPDSKVQIVLTTRPDAFPDSTKNALEVAFLNDDMIEDLIEDKLRKQIENSNIYKYDELMQDKSDIVDMLNTHWYEGNFFKRFRAIDGLIKYLTTIDVTLLEVDQTEVVVDEKGESRTSSPPEEKSISNVKRFYENDEVAIDKSEQKAFQKRKNFSNLERTLEDSEELLQKGVSDISIEHTRHIDGIKKELNLALILKDVVDFVREKEKKRKRSWGTKSKVDTLSEEADYYIEKTAWKHSWKTKEFNSRKYFDSNSVSLSDLLDWNLHVGFIQKERKMFYAYTSHVIRCFLGAVFAYDWYEDEKSFTKELGNRNDIDQDAFLLGLLNMLREANGLEKINFKLERS